MVDEALASSAYTSATGGARTPSRKTRWTTDQIEALIEGVEKYGLSAWRTIVMVRRRRRLQGCCRGAAAAACVAPCCWPGMAVCVLAGAWPIGCWLCCPGL
eukprot:GHRQ01019125.1.p3 GENE.GHRQ01019125.1~~GHRQ01019125.1.p3  ORF type:complete len:101 (-),score=36.46 GHRQ01019125.1:289-591(-)